MTWSPRSPKWPWRDYLTPEEAATIWVLDGDIATARKAQARASAIRAPIVNRAIQRAKYEATKLAESEYRRNDESE